MFCNTNLLTYDFTISVFFTQYSHNQLYLWRQEIVKNGYTSISKTVAMKGMAAVFSNSTLFNFLGKFGKKIMKMMPFMVNNQLNVWCKQREMLEPPQESFMDWCEKNRKS